jgi:hypothetical protein
VSRKASKSGGLVVDLCRVASPGPATMGEPCYVCGETPTTWPWPMPDGPTRWAFGCARVNGKEYHPLCRVCYGRGKSTADNVARKYYGKDDLSSIQRITDRDTLDAMRDKLGGASSH